MTRAAVASSERVLIIIANKVYDVTDYAEDHPGGEDVMLEHQGADATTEFQDVGHSRAAQQELARYLVAKLEAGDCA
ncbi:hypothetical protein FNF27_05893 [Cafeteria roenbergensis]|nr:hypothetical protein FNF27_05893 [Cafeteria roenbergensis]